MRFTYMGRKNWNLKQQHTFHVARNLCDAVSRLFFLLYPVHTVLVWSPTQTWWDTTFLLDAYAFYATWLRNESNNNKMFQIGFIFFMCVSCVYRLDYRCNKAKQKCVQSLRFPCVCVCQQRWWVWKWKIYIFFVEWRFVWSTSSPDMQITLKVKCAAVNQIKWMDFFVIWEGVAEWKADKRWDQLENWS